MRYTVLIAVAGTLVLALALAPAREAGSAPGAALLPDLVTLRFDPEQLAIEREKNKVKLSFANEIGNRGIGPLELVPGPERRDPDCNEDGDPENDRVTLQRVFKDDGDGSFDRAEDTGFTVRQAGCTFFHPRHRHWHFDRFARYTLVSEDSGEIVRRSKKISFCVVDTLNFRTGLPGDPGERYYTSEAGGPNPLEGCQSPHATVGLSVGWADVYVRILPGQSFRVDDLEPGTYCLISEVDPGGLLAETDDSNNRRAQRVKIDPGSLRALFRDGRCRQ